jgi:GAF domain-containing protein
MTSKPITWTAGDVCLARNLAEELRVARMLARQEQDVHLLTGVKFGVGTERHG